MSRTNLRGRTPNYPQRRQTFYAERVGIMLEHARQTARGTVEKRRGIPRNTTYEFTFGDQTIKVTKISQGRHLPDYQAVLSESTSDGTVDLRHELGWLSTRSLYQSVERLYHVREAQKTNGLV
jgi:hypothetical protein